MSELVGAAGQVFAFEPETHNFQLLEQNLRCNGITNVVLQVHRERPGRHLSDWVDSRQLRRS
jgi:hypothetical protein